MYILPTLTYLEVVVPADASKFFIFEHFKWEPIGVGEEQAKDLPHAARPLGR